MSLELQKQDDRVRHLISSAKERGYGIYDEVTETLPPPISTSEEIKNPFTAFEHHNIPVYDNALETKTAHGVIENPEGGEVEEHEGLAHDEEAETDETATLADKTSDPVRVYLREMGSVPLFKREEEVAIAKRMERGHDSGAQDNFPLSAGAQGAHRNWPEIRATARVPSEKFSSSTKKS